MPCSTRLRTMPCVVEGARSRRDASSDRLIRRVPWSAVRIRIARSTDWITAVPFWCDGFHEKSCALVNHRRTVQSTFDIVERHSIGPDRGTGMLDETTLFQRLGAEAIGTAFLVFIGVGS